MRDADRDGLLRAAAGDERAAAALFDRFGGMLYAVALRIVREGTDAEEVVAETFVQAWRSARTFDGARGSLATWLVMICRSRALDHVRARTRRERATEAAGRDGGDDAPPAMSIAPRSPAADAEQREREVLVASALAALPDVQRRAIELAFWDGLSHSEIADRLQEPLGTVKTRVRLGMQKLRDALQPLLGDDSA